MESTAEARATEKSSSEPAAKRNKVDLSDAASASTSDDSSSGLNGDVRLSPFNTICADGEYVGELNPFGEREGHGIMTYLDSSSKGDVFDGQWKADTMNGKGKMTYADGDVYDGDFVNGLFHGYGVYTYKSGDRYEGNWANDSFEGKGIYSDYRGSKYNGEWKQDKMHGKGTYVDAQGNKYDGFFREGKFDGHGKLNSTNGDCYEGNFEKGKKHGYGVLEDIDGNIYSGAWVDNKRCGYGTYKDVLGGMYKGQYRCDVRNGPGYYYWPDGETDAIMCSNDERCGNGIGWSQDRKQAWIMIDGEFQGYVSVDDGKRITEDLGLEVPKELLLLR